MAQAVGCRQLRHMRLINIEQLDAPAVRQQALRQLARLILNADDHDIQDLVVGDVLGQVRFADQPDGELEEGRSGKLAQHNRRHHQGGEIAAQPGELYCDFFRQPQANAGLGDICHPGQPIELRRIARHRCRQYSRR